MTDEMGSFRVDIELENPARPGMRLAVHRVLVDTGAELSCVPAAALDALGIARRRLLRFRQADGSVFERWTGSALVYAGDASATDDVVFGEPDDLVLLGARSLEGLNLRIDPVSRRLIDAGPMPLAAVSRGRDVIPHAREGVSGSRLACCWPATSEGQWIPTLAPLVRDDACAWQSEL